MPFGLTNAFQTMTRLMDKVILAELRNEVLVYLDNLLIVPLVAMFRLLA